MARSGDVLEHPVTRERVVWRKGWYPRYTAEPVARGLRVGSEV